MENHNNPTSFYNHMRYVEGLSPMTCDVYLKYIIALNNFNNDYCDLLISKTKINNNTKRVLLSAVKKYYIYTNDDRQSEIKLPKKKYSIQDYLTFKEYKRICYTIGNSNQRAIRDSLIIKLLFETGVRSQELLNIETKDIHNDYIIVKGKGNKERIVYLNKTLHNSLSEYIETIHINGRLFNFGYKNLYRIVNQRSYIIKRNLTPHMLRRGFATHCVNKEIGLYELSLLMGHSDINVTKGYVHSYKKARKVLTIF